MTLGQDRWSQIADAFVGRRDGGQAVAAGLCSAAVEVLAVAGAGIIVMADGGTQVSLCVSDAIAEALAELEFTLGIGPAVEADGSGVAVVEIDLVNRPPSRWAGYCGPAVDAGIRAVFAFPLRLGAVRLGALVLYQVHPGAMGDDSYADALIAAEVITRAVLTRRAGVSEEALMAEVAEGAAFHAEVHQASGMVSVQLDIGVGDALALLRARAFAGGRPVADVAADVVARRLRFDE